MKDFRYIVYRFVKRIRVTVTGPLGAGKTTLIKSLSEHFDTISVEKYVSEVGTYNTTIAYDHGVRYLLRDKSGFRPLTEDEARSIVLSGDYSCLVRVDFWGAAGQRHLAELRRALIYPKAEAVMFVVDLSRPECLVDAVFLLNELYREVPGVRSGTVPLTLILNKTDNRVVDDQYFVKGLELCDTVKVFRTSAIHKEGVWEPLFYLLAEKLKD